MSISEYLYCIELVGGDIAKIGTTCRPRSRLTSLMSGSPFNMRFRHLLMLDDRGVAASWERHIIANSDPHTGRGEWVACNDKMDALFRSAPGKSALHKFPKMAAPGISLDPDRAEASNTDALVHGLSRPHGQQPRAKDFKGIVSNYERTVIHTRLHSGYGVEDIHVMDGLSLAMIRAEVARLTADGQLRRVLGLSPTPTEARA
jgi:hypothetical protein